jgi:putative peptide zinc metalloprotease protein
LEIRQAAERLEKRVQSGITREELETVLAELGLLREEAAGLLVHTEVAGLFVLPEERRLPGRYLRRGELIGYVISPQRLIVRTVVPQSDIGLVRLRVEQVEVRLAERLGEAIPAVIVRETPAGNTALPSRALGAVGGGEIAVRAIQDQGLTAAEKVFQVDLGVPEDVNISGVGERVYVRFHHGVEPLASQWLRSGRQLVLSRLSF